MSLSTMKTFITSTLLFLAITTIQAQQQEFNQLFNELESAIGLVETSKYKYEPELLFEHTSVIKYSYTKTSLKGTVNTYAYELNIADIDPYTVRESTEKDLIVVNIKIKNSQDLIKTFEDQEVKSYTEELQIVAANIDNARKIRSIIEKAIPLAEKIMLNKLSLSNYDEMLTWLTANVKDATYADESYAQAMQPDPTYAGKVNLSIVETGKSTKQSDYSFNLADINVNTVRFDISGSEFGLEFETKRKHNLIKYIEDGESKPFINDLVIKTNNVEEARDLLTVLTLIIPEAEKQVEASFPVFGNQTETLNAVSKNTKALTYGSDTYEQTFNADCLAEYVITEISESKSEKTQYNFNWIDINDKVIDYKISGSKMYIELITNKKQKLIKVLEDGELEPYDETFKLYCEDAENARRLQYTIKQTIEKCRQNYQAEVPNEGLKAKIDWLTGAVKEVREGDETYSQTLTLVEDDNLEKFKFTKLEIDEKGSTEYIYELNFADLNERNIDFDVSSRSISVKIETNFKEKIIKNYKDGEIQNYEDELTIHANNIEESRNLIKALVDIVTLTKGK
ncbi:hypothetical protein N7E81_00990 [Reichenbachiella carrageenanivorans]|uniref:DUF4468 domain-containing protein n=1 Tax=Reichenbachiella carrageenanivorans TaxID=2979869 RepID=A0ABY6D0K8_9BACT|nr:hypothetical protein [Reichenbachiella carrageenanivorans]UXX79686.1 hypothetical protein N7E81_00990 [Reichenbachiella carrageenanivorans]